MRINFTATHLAIAISSLAVASAANASGMDRSGQDTTAFFQDGTYAEAVYTYIDADVTGQDINGREINDIAEDYDFFRYGVKADVDNTFSVGVIYDEPWGAAANYTGTNDFVGAPTATVDALISSRLGDGVKDPKDNKGINNVAQLKGFISQTENKLAGGKKQLDQLKGFEAQLKNAINSGAPLDVIDKQVAQTAVQLGLNDVNSFNDLNKFIKGNEQALAKGQEDYKRLKGLEAVLNKTLANDEPTQVEVRSKSLTGLIGMKLGQNKNFQIYGGPVAQSLDADVHLRGDGYQAASGYDLHLNSDVDYGWIAGVQYSKPEIALKASLTYRSEIDHEVKAAENFPILVLRGDDPIQLNKMDITTPESVNFDFQTGVNSTTLATAKVRWVPWSDFNITPPTYNKASKSPEFPKGLNLVDYSEDQWQVELGLAKRLNPALAVSGSVGWDSGAGEPASSLGPVDGYYSVGLGAKYNVTDEWAISAGGKYLWLGDAEAELPNGDRVSNFKDNDGYIVGVKLSYQGK